jgi:hypothetical protein
MGNEMNIFEYVDNDKFFNPLSSKNKKIYFDCINLIIEKSKEVPILYDSDARNCVAFHLKNSEYEFQDEKDSGITDEGKSEKNASTIMMYLRECGWVTPREIGRNGENVANVSTNCRKVIEFLKKMGENSNEGALSNHIFSMYEILKASFEADSVRMERPYTSILKPLIDNEVELKNELLDLKDNIVTIMRFVMELQDVNSVGKFLMRDELLGRFFNDYFFIKNNGLIPSQLAFIRNKLRVISQGEIFEKIISEYEAQKQIERQEAREKIESYLSSLQYFLTIEYEEHMELIDARINTYYNLANTRLMLVMGSGMNLESAIDAFLSNMKTMEESERQAMLEEVTRCMLIGSQKYISSKSYQKRERKERDNSYIGLVVGELSEEEKVKRTAEMMNSTKNRFTIEETNDFFKNRFLNRKELNLVEQSIVNRKEAMMFASVVMYSGIEESDYEAELKEGFVESKAAKISNMVIRKK